jgi:hypothetical protein
VAQDNIEFLAVVHTVSNLLGSQNLKYILTRVMTINLSKRTTDIGDSTGIILNYSYNIRRGIYRQPQRLLRHQNRICPRGLIALWESKCRDLYQ